MAKVARRRRMAEADESEGEFDPTYLHTTIISRPLLELMEKGADEDRHDVVIDLNFKYQHGLAAAQERTLELMRERLEVTEEQIDRRKTKLSPQYVMGALTAAQIRGLADLVYSGMYDDWPSEFVNRTVFMIWPDFGLDAHIVKSAATVKADAAQRSFSADGSDIVWAVVDSGVDGGHAHFRRHGTLDLSSLETPLKHLDFTNDFNGAGSTSVDPLAPSPEEQKAALTDELGHGTHVAGIIAGAYQQDPAEIAEMTLRDVPDAGVELGDGPPGGRFPEPAEISRLRQTPAGTKDFYNYTVETVRGIAPRAKIVSYKVLDAQGAGKMSNILAALAHIQSVNEHGRWMRIHGVNLSVGYGFNPEWFACGQSPLCVEVNRLVRSGVVVVVSAGNSGYGSKITKMTGTIRAGMLMTINDPGNADLAITVGSTHREMPHVFGASYFSSKGPTGDGRRKPDLLAPGERIVSCAAGTYAAERTHGGDPSRLYLDRSGTSMAAPHVSGAIAAFLSIRREFIGQPERVKRIFLDTATDLGRDPYMQGAGMLDLMRAIQSV
ncbi:Subtilase family protein [Roseivivax lentus]|uniref:Subtilase family protein n=1 Tax=Roseivivax lentus TaxID=633194 RepID=A0A1N7KX06_9RHOB|nr:S8 family peptidase [Roseivivax lentus]SIS66125.1 Subtilase family protein [Roseivivax lentus]